MGVFGGCDFDICVVVNRANTGIVTKENFGIPSLILMSALTVRNCTRALMLASVRGP